MRVHLQIEESMRKFFVLLHKYLGLPIAIMMIYMSISGILLNHPSLIKHFDAPAFLLPPDMKVNNWGRGAVLTSAKLGDTLLVGGKLGVFKLFGDDVIEMNNGLPSSVQTGTIFSLFHDTLTSKIYAGSSSGLFCFDTANNEWIHVEGVRGKISVVSRFDSLLTAVSADTVYQLTNENWSRTTLTKNGVLKPKKHSRIEYLFGLHSGELLGLPGRIFMDGIALIFISLSITGIGLMFFPKWTRKKIKRQVKFHYTHHKKWGVLLIIPMLIIPVTGFFMRPPFMMLFREPAPKQMESPQITEIPLHEDIVSIIEQEDSLHIVTKKHLYITSGFGEKLIEKAKLPVHPMGAYGAVAENDSTLLIGSFSGLLRYSHGEFYNYYGGDKINRTQFRKTGPYQVSGVMNVGGEIKIIDLRKGVFDLIDSLPLAAMPEVIQKRSTYSLWNFLFELHNGRILKTWLNGFYLIHNIVASIGTILVIISGYIIVIRIKKRK